MNEVKPSTEFKRRLFRLEKAIANYRETGNFGIILPLLFKCASYCWCKSPIIK